MKLKVFRCRGGFLLSPECMLASIEAQRAHGPVEMVGVVDSSRFPEAINIAISDEIFRRQFAFASEADGQRLGLDGLRGALDAPLTTAGRI